MSARSPSLPYSPNFSQQQQKYAPSPTPPTGFATTRQHLVSLKVLRLSRPIISQPRLLVPLDGNENEESRLPDVKEETSTFSFEVKEARPTAPEDEPILALPSTFGSLYVGETFKALLSLHSEVNSVIKLPTSPVQVSTGATFGRPQSPGIVKSKKETEPPYLAVTLSATVTTPDQKNPVTLINSSHPDSTTHMPPDGSKQYTVEFETMEVGVHTISVTVTYTPVQPLSSENPSRSGTPAPDSNEKKKPNGDEENVNVIRNTKDMDPSQAFPVVITGENTSFYAISSPVTYTKNYRFTTETGFNIGTKITAVAHDTYVLQTRIENLTDTTVTIETAEFLAPIGWVSKSLALSDTESSPQPKEAPSEVFSEKDGVPYEGESVDEYGLGDTPSDMFITNMDSPSLMPKEAWQFAYLVEHDSGFFTAPSGGPSNTSLIPVDPATGKPRSLQQPQIQQARQSVGTGKFSFSWRRENLGEKGWLMTGHLKRTANLEYWG